MEFDRIRKPTATSIFCPLEKIIYHSEKLPKMELLGTGSWFCKIFIICKGKFCNNSFKRSLYLQKFGKKSLNYCHPY